MTEIEAATDKLPPEELLFHAATRLEHAAQPSSPKPHVAGLHTGMWTIAPDFDAALPDEFWLGKDV